MLRRRDRAGRPQRRRRHPRRSLAGTRPHTDPERRRELQRHRQSAQRAQPEHRARRKSRHLRANGQVCALPSSPLVPPSTDPEGISGKSSLLALLLRLLDPLPATPTQLRIDDTPLATVDRAALRERLLSASQDPVLLPATSVRANLDPCRTADDDECAAVLQLVGLDAATPPEQLSAGQRQLFSVARAMLRRRVKARETGVDGGVLLLDEITASADAETEARVRDVLEREFAAWTVVVVTHRQGMAVGFCGRVVVVDGGRVVEEGRVGEEGRFAGLWGSR